MTALEQYFELAKARVRADAKDIVARAMVWQALAAREDWDRAHVQLDALAAMDPSWLMEVQSCQGLLACEKARLEVAAARAGIPWYGPAPPWAEHAQTGLRALASGQVDHAVGAFAEVRSQLIAAPGRVDEASFEWLCDGDARYQGVFEVMLGSNYFWIAQDQVASIQARAPEELRDRIWVHCQMSLIDKRSMACFMPARYPSPASDESRLGQSVEWAGISEDLFAGVGQRTFVTDQQEFGVLDIRRLEFAAGE